MVAGSPQCHRGSLGRSPVVTAHPQAFRIVLGSADAAEHVAYAAFLASLHGQETTGDLWAAISPEDLYSQLELCENATPGAAHVELWNLGVDPASDDDLGFVLLIAPTQESPEVLTFDLVPDVAFQPLPDDSRDAALQRTQPFVRTALEIVRGRAQALDRRVIQTSVLHPVETPGPFHLLVHTLCAQGFSVVHEEKHTVLSARQAATPSESTTGLPEGIEWIYLDAWDQRTDLIPGICRLWEQADTDIPRGHLHFQPTAWTPERLREARERALADGSDTLSVVAWHPRDGVVGISTALSAAGVHWAAAELGTTIVDRAYRPSALGLHLVGEMLESIQRGHNHYHSNFESARLYASAPDPIHDADAYPMARVLELLDASPICAETHLQMLIDD